MKGESIARMIGSRRITPYYIHIGQPEGVFRDSKGVARNAVTPPYMPKSITDAYHPGGNSLCYSIQTAHLMGASQIYAMGFTLQDGSPYFWGDRVNPILKRSSIYDTHRALPWLKWYESKWPGRVKLVEGWDGPVYEVLQKVTYDELRARFEAKSSSASERDPEPRGQEPAGKWLL